MTDEEYYASWAAQQIISMPLSDVYVLIERADDWHLKDEHVEALKKILNNKKKKRKK